MQGLDEDPGLYAFAPSAAVQLPLFPSSIPTSLPNNNSFPHSLPPPENLQNHPGLDHGHPHPLQATSSFSAPLPLQPPPPSSALPFPSTSSNNDAFQFDLQALTDYLSRDDASSTGTPSYRSSNSDVDQNDEAVYSDTSSSYEDTETFHTRYLQHQQHLQHPPPSLSAQLESSSFASHSQYLRQSTMATESNAREEEPGLAALGQGNNGRRSSRSDRDRDLTLTIPRRRAASPAGGPQDDGRPFSYKRTSSGFSSWMNYAASPTSDLRTRPPTPAESATRSTFGGAISASPPTSSAPFFADSPATMLPQLEIPSAPALQLTGATPFTARPKGRGTLELERVLGMWAAKTPTSSFPNLPPLPSSSAAPAPSQPLFAQTVLASEPESFEAAPSVQLDPPQLAASSVFTFPTFAPTSFPPAPADSLAPPRFLPRRQRSKSEADIMRSSEFSFGEPAAATAGSDAALDLNSRYIPPFGQAAVTEGMNPSDVWNAPLNPLNDATAFTSATPAFSSLSLAGEQHELTSRARPPLERPHRSAGGPGYHEAAFLDVPGHSRRARSQGAGHRRTAKSDDFSHLFSTASVADYYLQPGRQPTYAVSENGQLAPPGEASPAASSYHSPSPSQSPAFQPGPPPVAAYPIGQQHPQLPSFIPGGQPVLIPLSRLAGPSSDISHTPAQFFTASNGGQHYPPQPQPQPQSQHYTFPSPQQQQHGYALAAAAAAAAAANTQQNQGLQYLPYLPAPAPAPVQPPPSQSLHRASFSGGSPHLPPQPYRGVSPASQPSPPGGYAYAQQQQQQPPPRTAPLYPYNSPQQIAYSVLPSPPTTAGVGGGPSPGPSGAGSYRSARSGSIVGGESGDRDDPMSGTSGAEDDEDGDEGEEGEEDDSGAYSDEGPKKSRARASSSASVSVGAATAKGKGKGKKKASPRAGAGGDSTKESKTTQATIEAAKKRRNSNTVAKFVCELCGETFTRRYNLRGHQRAHKGEKPYKCSHEGCEKAFARAHDCKRHELLHLGTKKYNCSPCKRDFVRLDALHRHHRSEVGQICVRQLQAEGHVFDEKGQAVHL